MTNKMTKKEKFMMLLNIEEVAESSTLVEFIKHELELLEKKSGSSKKATAKQKENSEFKRIIVMCMEPTRLYTITEIQREILPELTPQRVSALITQLKGEEKVIRTVEKRVAYFQLATEPEEEAETETEVKVEAEVETEVEAEVEVEVETEVEEA